MANTTVQADLTATGNTINTNLTNLTNRMSSLSKTQYFEYPSYAGGARHYNIGRLNLPTGGYQAVITINLCYGFNVNSQGLNSPGYNIQNYAMNIHLYSSTTSH